jgi:hypothetical protein
MHVADHQASAGAQDATRLAERTRDSVVVEVFEYLKRNCGVGPAVVDREILRLSSDQRHVLRVSAAPACGRKHVVARIDTDDGPVRADRAGYLHSLVAGTAPDIDDPPARPRRKPVEVPAPALRGIGPVVSGVENSLGRFVKAQHGTLRSPSGDLSGAG